MQSAPKARLIQQTKTTATLASLPPPSQPIDVAVYDFPDLTGQAKPNPSFAEYSRAVTQGGAAMLVDVLTTAGAGSWFRVVERTGLKDLVQERTLIENTRKAYAGSGGKPLSPVRFAGIILEGGIIGYNSDYVTGGAGARYFGIGGDVQYRADLVTVNMRAVSVDTGEVLASTTVSKQVYSLPEPGKCLYLHRSAPPARDRGRIFAQRSRRARGARGDGAGHLLDDHRRAEERPVATQRSRQRRRR